MRSERRPRGWARTRGASLLIALLAAGHAHAQAVPPPAPPKSAAKKPPPAPAKPKPPPPKAKPPAPPVKALPEDEAIVRDLELYMLFEMLNDYELFYDDDQTRPKTQNAR
jgi:hypothetical protein